MGMVLVRQVVQAVKWLPIPQSPLRLPLLEFLLLGVQAVGGAFALRARANARLPLSSHVTRSQ